MRVPLDERYRIFEVGIVGEKPDVHGVSLDDYL
jgi:hypothetical protein